MLSTIIQSQRVKGTIKYIPEIFIITFFTLIQLQHINIDFWNDEIYTLKHFTFTSLFHTISDYHVPNNHIFFNLINNIYLKIIGIDSLYSLMDSPYILRIVPFIYSLTTLIYTYKLTLRISNRQISILTIIILTTTISYYNFALQIRGYGLSTMLFVLISYQISIFYKTQKSKQLIYIALLTTILFYTIPSNIYYIFSAFFFFSMIILKDTISAFHATKKINFRKISLSKEFKLSSSLTIGVLTAFLFYIPLFKEVFMNEYVVPGSPFDVNKLWFYMTGIGKGLISGRWILIIICTVGLLKNYRYLLKNKETILCLITVITLPILITFSRGDNAPLRVFTVCIPIFSILLSFGIYAFYNSFFKKENHFLFFYIPILAYSFIIFNLELIKIENKIANDIETGGRSQNLYSQYYSFHYTPLKETKFLYTKQLKYAQIPVIQIGCEPHGISNYFEKFNVKLYNICNYDSLLSSRDSIIVVTNNANLFSDSTRIKSQRLNPIKSYHNILLITHIKRFKR